MNFETANGDVHMGHAVNKILKDIILKQKIMKGTKVHYIPGFDCHGLPIELKALGSQKDLTPIEIRSQARKFATETIEKQTRSFKSWGVIGDWNVKNQVYRTFDNSYIKNQLKIFYEMFKKNLIYRDLKPVYWSPSSASALAEAELEYDDKFISHSLYCKFNVVNSEEIYGENFNVLIWTTTPWTLPANQAVCFNTSLSYCLADVNGENFILGHDAVANLSRELACEIKIIKEMNSNNFEKLKYRHPINSSEELPFLSSSHVIADKGTGFVHTAPSHGHDDFLVFMNKKTALKKLVDETGCYNNSAPAFLRGKKVLEDGNKLVLECIGENILKLRDFTHSYPIDWRTKKPVIILASEQWFINTEKLKANAIREVENVNIFPIKSSQVFKDLLKTQLSKRPYWCISRQRSWGVPIPILYMFNGSTWQPFVNQACIEFWIYLIDKHGSLDFWFDSNVEDLLPASEKHLSGKLKKGNDILDIWFDSGVSWSFALKGSKIADLYLEGVDQFTGWFQSSLMTSVAVREIAPYKNILVHGFTVDENGNKMSKSLGNVINPEEIINKYGVDSLRWWVASHATQHSSIPASKTLLEDAASNLSKIRSSFKYLKGSMSKTEDSIQIDSATHLDKYLLHRLSEFKNNTDLNYEKIMLNRNIALINNFVNTDLSSCYLHLIKDRLYCGSECEFKHLQKILRECYLVLSESVWPIIPFMVEESWSHLNDQSFYKSKNDLKMTKWEFPDSVRIIENAMHVKKSLYSRIKDLNTWRLDVKLSVNDQMLEDFTVSGN